MVESALPIIHELLQDAVSEAGESELLAEMSQNSRDTLSFGTLILARVLRPVLVRKHRFLRGIGECVKTVPIASLNTASLSDLAFGSIFGTLRRI